MDQVSKYFCHCIEEDMLNAAALTQSKRYEVIFTNGIFSVFYIFVVFKDSLQNTKYKGFLSLIVTYYHLLVIIIYYIIFLLPLFLPSFEFFTTEMTIACSLKEPDELDNDIVPKFFQVAQNT